MSEIKVNKISPATSTAIQLGDSGDTFTVPSGATIVNSGTATGFGGGKVLQALGATDSTPRTTTSGSFIANSNTLSVAITPASTGSKFFISVNTAFTQAAGASSYYTLYRDSTNIGDSTYGFSTNVVFNSTAFNMPIGFSYLDSPSASSQITYQLYYKTSSSVTLNQNGVKGSITVIEIGA